MENQSATPSGPEKNKGGRPKGKQQLFNRKVTFYLSDEEYSLLTAFVEQGWHDRNYSGAARFLLLRTLGQWDKKGRKPVSLRGEF